MGVGRVPRLDVFLCPLHCPRPLRYFDTSSPRHSRTSLTYSGERQMAERAVVASSSPWSRYVPKSHVSRIQICGSHSGASSLRLDFRSESRRDREVCVCVSTSHLQNPTGEGETVAVPSPPVVGSLSESEGIERKTEGRERIETLEELGESYTGARTQGESRLFPSLV